jgi:hypothetical protein
MAQTYYLGPTGPSGSPEDSLKVLRVDERPLLAFKQAAALASLAVFILIVGVVVQVQGVSKDYIHT